MIFAIGSQRFALDLKTAITRLDPATGDKPASIVPFYKPKKEEP